MQIKQNPFSLYDFLGYLVPGSVALYASVFVWARFSQDFSGLEYLRNNLSVTSIELYIPFVLASYITGHFLSFLSSVTVERYAIWCLGYPSKYLLGYAHPGYFSTEKKKKRRRFIRIAIWVFLLPLSLLDLIFGKLFGLREIYAKELDPLLRKLLKQSMNQLLKEHPCLPPPKRDGEARNQDFFRYAYHYALERCEGHVPKFQNYVALYGFLRVLTLICTILFWVAVTDVLMLNHDLKLSLAALLVPCAVAYVLYMAFLKFFTRFSLEVLMAVSVECHEESYRRASRI